MNTFGTHFRITSFGESHGPAMGVVIDGCPAGVLFSHSLLDQHLKRRRPGQFAWQSSRNEPDQAEVLSGVFESKTLGTPIAMIVKNQDQRSSDYNLLQTVKRKGHADDLWKKKFQHSDLRGGGRASGRETISRVMGGAVARMFLNQVHQDFQILSYANQIGEVILERNDFSLEELWLNQKTLQTDLCYFPHKKKSKQIVKNLIEAKKTGKSYGGSVMIHIKGIPLGLGRPVFHKLKADLASALMGVGSVCAVLLGEQVMDQISLEGNDFHQNQKAYGGIRGGLSTGEDICLQVLFKPTSSIGEISKKGRHDPCIIPRAIPVLESMIELVLADHLLAKRLDH